MPLLTEAQASEGVGQEGIKNRERLGGDGPVSRDCDENREKGVSQIERPDAGNLGVGGPSCRVQPEARGPAAVQHLRLLSPGNKGTVAGNKLDRAFRVSVPDGVGEVYGDMTAAEFEHKPVRSDVFVGLHDTARPLSCCRQRKAPFCIGSDLSWMGSSVGGEASREPPRGTRSRARGAATFARKAQRLKGLSRLVARDGDA